MYLSDLLARCTNPKNSRSYGLLWKGVLGIFLLLVLILFIVLHNVLNSVPLQNQTSRWHTALPVEEIWLGEKGEEDSRPKCDEEFQALRKKEADELKTIKVTALNELRDIERKRYSMLEEIKTLSEKKASLTKGIKKIERDQSKLRDQLQVLRSAVASKRSEVNIPIGMPKQLHEIPHEDPVKKYAPQQLKSSCVLSNCFDYSHCSLLNRFSVFVYKPVGEYTIPTDVTETKYVYREIKKLPHVVNIPHEACMFLVILVISPVDYRGYQKGALLKHLKKLKKWENNGQNHVILFLSKMAVNETCKYVAEVSKTNAIVVTNTFCKTSFRKDFDLLVNPTEFFLVKDFHWNFLPQLVPIRRTYLFAFIEKTYSSRFSTSDILTLRGTLPDVYIRIDCTKLRTHDLHELNKFCNDVKPVADILKNAVFNVIYPTENWRMLDGFFFDILNSLKHGAIPVIIGDHSAYPYSDFIDYFKLAIFIPSARLTEVQYILRTIKKSDIFTMRKHGRFIYETYFSTLQTNALTIFSILQNKINLPPLPLEDYKTVPLLKSNSSVITGLRYESFTLKSIMYKRNWTGTNVDQYEHWNSFPGAHYLFQSRPRNNALPPSVQFFEDVHDYMPIGEGKGGDGNAFKNALGGDQAVEHFTVVILTYDRELILIESLQRLASLRYLNRVIVIWNNKIMPSEELDWPDIGVPLHVIKGGKNSLNNRFLPLDLIDTEAVLSMDDDIYLRFDEIELAFRVWRENRDRIVGFPGRFHSWNKGQGWSYNTSNSCELSMVLTGGAFFHKYYLYLYTYLMPQPIRDMVDEYMNCEDIAMNFLVSHATSRPPIKVTSRWTFRCPGCPTSLSNDYTHYIERAKCLKFFKEVYGYMPLRRTQFRADSVLFKTRLSAGGVKCYQFV